ncbi:CCDC180 [Bugula neritina]|uniref:CCDC180 n=1 Tax=Bugula neritina TaxID=10212 RepID=A0A7J7KDS9_BUGNE|nr:CCDC180 [Bugula neritina]
MIDLVFIERVARWLTNTQVKVKAEVAESNQQAKTLALHLNELEKRIDACEKPNLDKEVVSCSDLVASLKPIFTSFHKRADYIDCRITDSSETGETKTGTVTKPSKVGFADAAPPGLSSLAPSGPTALTGGGGKQKQAVEDPTVTIVKNIYKTQRPAERAASPSVKDKKSEQVSQSAAAEGADNKPTGSESRPLTEKSGKTRSNKQSRASQRRGSSVGESKNRHSSAARRITRFDRKDKRFQLFPDELPVDSEYYEKVFDDLLGKIRRVIREAHEGLIAAAEAFYKQKRPLHINCSLTFTRLLTTTTSACKVLAIQQSYSLEYFVLKIPTPAGQTGNFNGENSALVIKDNKRSSEAEYAAQRAQLQRAFMERMEQIDRTRFEHKTLLRPTLGHPNHAAKMAALCSDEGKRSELCVQEINDYEIALKRLGEEHAAMFIEKISASSAELLLLFDDMLTVDDVIKGKIIPNKYPTNELLRRNKHGEPLFDKIPETLIPRGAATWQGVSTDEMIVLKPPPTSNIKESKLKSSTASSKPKFTANIHTQKTTIGHNSTLESRDDAYKTYKMEFYQTISHIEKEKEERLLDESRWTDSWSNSIQKIRSLY